MVPHHRAEASACMGRMLPGSTGGVLREHPSSRAPEVCSVQAASLWAQSQSQLSWSHSVWETGLGRNVHSGTRSSLSEGWTLLCGVLRTRR